MPTALHVKHAEGKPGKVYYELENRSYEIPKLTEGKVLVRVTACALNHRDLFIRQALYPGIDFNVPLCADLCGTVVDTGSDSASQKWKGKRVVANPGTGWKDSPEGPESPQGYAILGATKLNPHGTAVTDYVTDASELEEAPDHLSSFEAASLPLAGLTAFRATVTKAPKAMAKGKNVLVTGIGGGVAIMALQFAVGAGANVYVSSGSQEKIDKAKQLGAKGGINYKEDGWEKTLRGMLPKENAQLDAIIDGAGGNIVEKGVKLLKPGGVISIYGMTVSPKMEWNMQAVMKNLELRGSTMGSRKEFADMVAFVAKNKVKPVVSKVAKGLDNIKDINGLFDDMNKGSQFGKLVIEVAKEDGSKL